MNDSTAYAGKNATARVVQQARLLTSGAQHVLDLSGIGHDRARHAQLLPLSMLAWWVLSTGADASGWTCRLPSRGSAALSHLARAGVITAAAVRGMKLVYGDTGASFHHADLIGGAAGAPVRLPGVDWAVLDEGEQGQRLRIVHDLADPRRVLPRRDDRWDARRHTFAWLGNLGVASRALSPHGYQRFLADVDAVLYELIENVHLWSRADRAFSVVSTTRGGSADGTRSWNRLHIVVADAGVGVPTALREDLDALQAVHAVSTDSTPLQKLTDAQLVERLMRFAFGDRQLANHNGHGLNAAQVRAGQWVGALDIVTVGGDGSVFRRGSRRVNPAAFDAEDAIGLPEARGTLVHLMLQATDNESHRRSAAELEQLQLDDYAYSHAVRDSYEAVSATACA